jgi:hypothetical protein
MAKKRNGDNEKDTPSDADEKQPRRRRKRPARLDNPDADPVRIHREYVERRMGGGGEPTPEAYARALKQWHELPGAVSAPPTEVTGDEAAGAEEIEEEEDTQREAGAAEEEEEEGPA